MEIERINENTVKFYISYGDLEERGFNHEDIWHNRDKSEELFWNMMEELDYEEQFNPDGPLWIQVQALKKGLEVVVTKANLTKEGINIELPLNQNVKEDEDKALDDVEKQIEAILDTQTVSDSDEKIELDSLNFVLEIKELEDLISLAHQPKVSELTSHLFYYEERYYVEVEFNSNKNDIDTIDNILSLLLEYGEESERSPYVMKEYGKIIASEQAFAVIKEKFSK